MKECPNCKVVYNKPTKYCSAKCYRSMPVSDEAKQKMSQASKGKPKSEETKARMSAAAKGKPKPWQIGENNVNYENKAQSRPDVWPRFLESVKERGQPWTDEHKAAHSQLMLGPANAMRGKHHTDETKAHLSEAKKDQYRQGKVRFRHYKVSSAEHEILAWLTDHKVEVVPQYHIAGETYLYDFYFPDTGILLEYQGDYWHANPLKYNSGTSLKIQNVGIVKVDAIWEKDRAKRQAAENRGYTVVYLWEMDFKKRGFAALQELLPFVG